MLNYFKTLWRPEVYHGTGKKGNFFEGWFFKIVDEAKENIYAFIPGISLGDDPHAFIQVLDGQTHQSNYIRFPLQDFKASPKKMDIQIGNNIFTETGFQLNIEKEERRITGKVEFYSLLPWPVKLTSPGVMGWYAFVPFMECFHGVLSFDHIIHGTLSVNGKDINFDKGRGYIEKDWGKSFPNAYIWIQSNHFEQPGVSLMASVAKIPWLTGAFRGFIIGLFINEKLYRFTTYNGSKLDDLRLTDSQVQLQVSNKKFQLKIKAIRTEGGLLNAPYHKQMLTRISETLSSQVKVDLYQLNKDENLLVFSGEGNPAGLDVNGRLEEIVDS
jgi:tocopherol cyclase